MHCQEGKHWMWYMKTCIPSAHINKDNYSCSKCQELYPVTSMKLQNEAVAANLLKTEQVSLSTDAVSVNVVKK